MNEWREVALQKLPEIKSEIKDAETPMAFWGELIYHFDNAYEEPRNDDFIRRVYAYADWCLNQNVGETAAEHLPTCVAVCFWEHIPAFKPARDDMQRWIPFDDVMLNQHFFKHLLSDAEFDELKGLYANAKGSR
ncbi:MAG: hypothetical protein M3362_12955 [Acidobacteriota bacterium]|nr:hypothetical protein [Acidobacteriota bacterium]